MALPGHQGLCMSYPGLGLVGWGKEGQTRKGKGTHKQEDTCALGYLRALQQVRRVEGCSWEFVGRERLEPEQHGEWWESFSFRQRPRHGREGVADLYRLVEGDGVTHVGPVTYKQELLQSCSRSWPDDRSTESDSRGTPESIAVPLPGGTKAFPYFFTPQRNAKENGNEKNSELSEHLSKRDKGNSHARVDFKN